MFQGLREVAVLQALSIRGDLPCCASCWVFPARPAHVSPVSLAAYLLSPLLPAYVLRSYLLSPLLPGYVCCCHQQAYLAAYQFMAQCADMVQAQRAGAGLSLRPRLRLLGDRPYYDDADRKHQ